MTSTPYRTMMIEKSKKGKPKNNKQRSNCKRNLDFEDKQSSNEAISNSSESRTQCIICHEEFEEDCISVRPARAGLMKNVQVLILQMSIITVMCVLQERLQRTISFRSVQGYLPILFLDCNLQFQCLFFLNSIIDFYVFSHTVSLLFVTVFQCVILKFS